VTGEAQKGNPGRKSGGFGTIHARGGGGVQTGKRCHEHSIMETKKDLRGKELGTTIEVRLEVQRKRRNRSKSKGATTELKRSLKRVERKGPRLTGKKKGLKRGGKISGGEGGVWVTIFRKGKRKETKTDTEEEFKRISNRVQRGGGAGRDGDQSGTGGKGGGEGKNKKGKVGGFQRGQKGRLGKKFADRHGGQQGWWVGGGVGAQ